MVDESVPFYFTTSGAEQSVPGKMRWVTTYIARFDPDIDWPKDLIFELRINPNLKAWDGTALESIEQSADSDEKDSKELAAPDNSWSRKYYTDKLSSSGYASVSSAQAMAASGNQWSSTVSPASGYTPECPSDGKLRLTLRGAVELDKIKSRFVITPSRTDITAGAKPDLPTLVVEACSSGTRTVLIDAASTSDGKEYAFEETTCVQLLPRNLQVGKSYKTQCENPYFDSLFSVLYFHTR